MATTWDGSSIKTSNLYDTKVEDDGYGTYYRVVLDAVEPGGYGEFLIHDSGETSCDAGFAKSWDFSKYYHISDYTFTKYKYASYPVDKGWDSAADVNANADWNSTWLTLAELKAVSDNDKRYFYIKCILQQEAGIAQGWLYLRGYTYDADIIPLSVDIKDILIANNFGAFAGKDDWAVNVSVMPDMPNKTISVHDVIGAVEGRILDTKKILDKLAFQIRVRSNTYKEGWTKLQKINAVLDNLNGFDGISRSYRTVKRLQEGIPLGKDERNRFLFSCNYLVTVAD